MAETRSAAVQQTGTDNMISFLMAIPVGVSLLRRSWSLPPRGALYAMVPAAGGGVGDPDRLPQLPRSGGCSPAPGGSQPGAGPG